MRTRIVNTGDGEGFVIIPEQSLKKCRLGEEVCMEVRGESIVIQSHPVKRPREGWEESFRLMGERGDDVLLGPPTPTKFDETEWKW